MEGENGPQIHELDCSQNAFHRTIQPENWPILPISKDRELPFLREKKTATYPWSLNQIP